MPKMIITTVTCQQCGRLFTAGKYTRFCPDCRKIRAAAHCREVCRRRKQRFRREIGGVYACIDCGVEYVLTSGLQVCCPACERASEPPVVQQDAKVCPRCGRSFYDPRGNSHYCSLECWDDVQKERYRDIYTSKATIAQERLVESAKTKLQVMRLSAGLSLSQLAIRAGTSYTSLSAYENGRRNVRSMSDDLASRIAAVLQCSVYDVRASIDTPKPSSKLKELRRAAGITQVELSRQVGTTQATISSYERGILPLRGMSEQLAVRIAAALHCTPAEIKEE
nr:MAG TPA: Helix-turn-helix XRE-family like protein [Caudoviricetes sp.]